MTHRNCNICHDKQNQISSLMFVLNEIQHELNEHVKHGQPRQAVPSGAASSSPTVTKQPADPAAPPAYCNAKTHILAGNVEITCCQDGCHVGPHESFGGVQW